MLAEQRGLREGRRLPLSGVRWDSGRVGNRLLWLLLWRRIPRQLSHSQIAKVLLPLLDKLVRRYSWQHRFHTVGKVPIRSNGHMTRWTWRKCDRGWRYKAGSQIAAVCPEFQEFARTPLLLAFRSAGAAQADIRPARNVNSPQTTSSCRKRYEIGLVSSLRVEDKLKVSSNERYCTLCNRHSPPSGRAAWTGRIRPPRSRFLPLR